MPDRRKSPPRRRIKNSSDAWDRIGRFNLFHRGFNLRGSRDDSYPVIPEPDEELEDSELSEAERRSAIARERMRREGLL